jgi:SAM-dependent methyltransferase
MVDAIIDEFRLDRSRGTMLDFGYGGGEATFDLAPFFERVLAWNQDADILWLADNAIQDEGIKNIVLEEKGEADIAELPDKSLSLVVVAQSMHDINAEQFFGEIEGKIKGNGGGIAIISGGFTEPDGLFARRIAQERDRVLSNVVNRYIHTTEKKVEKATRNVNQKDYTTLLREAGFRKVQEQVFESVIERNIEEIIGWIYANKLFPRQKFGKKAVKFEKRLTRELKQLSPDGKFKDKMRFTLVSAKK